MQFITDTPSSHTKQKLSANKHHTLIFKALDGRQLARFVAPKGGWTPWDIWQVRQQLPAKWLQNGAHAYLGDELVGSTQL